MEALVELRHLIQRQMGSAGTGFAATAIPTLRVARFKVATEPIDLVYDPLVAVVAQGEKRCELGNRAFNYGAGRYLVVSAEMSIRSHIVSASEKNPFLGIVLTLKPTEIASLLLETGTSENSPAVLGIAVSDAPANLLDAIVRLLRLLEHPKDIPVLFAGC